MEGGLNVQAAPLGKPEQENATAPLNPKTCVAVTVETPEFPATTGVGDKLVPDSWKPGFVVLSCTAMPMTYVSSLNTMSGSPSLFMSAMTMGVRNGPLIVTGDPKLPSPFPGKTKE